MALPPLFEGDAQPSFSKRKILQTIFKFGIAFGIAFGIYQFKLDYFESWIYDIRIRTRPAPQPTDNFAIFNITPKTIETLQRAPDFRDHQLFLKQILDQNPLAVIYDLNIEDIKGTLPEKVDFAALTLSHPDFYVVTDSLTLPGEENSLHLGKPFEKVRLFSGPKSSDSKNFGKDGVTRRFLISYQGQEMLHVYLARKFNPMLNSRDNISGMFNFMGTEQAYIQYHPKNTYPIYDFNLNQNDNFQLSSLKNKIVIVGMDTQQSDSNYVATPYNRSVIGMTSSELHANIIDTLINNNATSRSPRWLEWIILAVVSVITVYVVFSLRPLVGISVLFGTVGALILGSYFLFWPFQVWMPISHALINIFLCYYLFIPYRLIIENRRSWEIYQKHQLLSQVEELKTNFISMMSHDLKTPIARIQGMVDIILRDSNSLSHSQRDAIDTIKHSGDDLLKFINSILQYGKIESQNVSLNYQSKDLNKLLGEIVKKHEFLAKLKHIQIQTDFEPMFPIEIDPELIGQVFSNLLENAIKYSPENTSVKIYTQDEGESVLVRFEDEGPGIPQDELNHIFMKFFRSRSVKTLNIKGSGLGLYLAKYFTELHHGSIWAESEIGQGSKFFVRLPVRKSTEPMI